MNVRSRYLQVLVGSRHLAALLVLVMPLVFAEDPDLAGLEDLPDPPPPPEPVLSGHTLEPEITIIQKRDETVEEYRHNGHLFMVKVTPTRGKPYYLMDSDGDGHLESRMSQLYSDFVIPKWVLFSW